jgi:hypothetical protein
MAMIHWFILILNQVKAIAGIGEPVADLARQDFDKG